MRYPNRLYAVERGDLHYILSGPASEDMSAEYRAFCQDADRREAEFMAEKRARIPSGGLRQ